MFCVRLKRNELEEYGTEEICQMILWTLLIRKAKNADYRVLDIFDGVFDDFGTFLSLFCLERICS